MRLLHKHSQFGYTSFPAEAMNGEPEAVDAETQRALTEEAKRRAQENKRALWQATRPRLDHDLNLLASALGREVASDLRAVQRTFDRIERRLAS